MATFGPIASANPNVLFDPARAIGAAQDLQRNQLMMEAAQTQQANAAEDRRQAVFERDRGLAAQLAGAVMLRPKEERAAAYAAGLAEYQREGRLPHAPPSYPGDEHMQRIYDASLTPTQLERRSERQTALAGLTGPGGLLGDGGRRRPAFRARRRPAAVGRLPPVRRSSRSSRRTCRKASTRKPTRSCGR
jgi:hypothetical protein